MTNEIRVRVPVAALPKFSVWRGVGGANGGELLGWWFLIMGTNYYLHRNACQHCKASRDRLHIGKSSGGWCFSLAIHPDEGINDLSDWIPLLQDNSNAIVNEYGDELSAESMLAVIKNRDRGGSCTSPPIGYRDWQEFHQLNCSCEGPNGLLRHKLDHIHCVKHGEGTWDCIAGSFS